MKHPLAHQLARLVLLALLVPAGAARADCDNPPNAWGSSGWSDYSRWCVECGGRPDVSTTSCIPGADWGRRGSQSQESSGPNWEEIRRQEALRQQMEAERRRQELARQKKAADEEAANREATAQARFEQARREALELMKGSGSDSLPLKSGTDFFRKQGSPGTPAGTRVREGMPPGVLAPAVRAWACAGWLTSNAFAAARKADVAEVRFLADTSGKVLRGETADVNCPELAPPPEVRGTAIDLGKLGPRYYGKLYLELTGQTGQLASARRKVAELLGSGKLTEQEIEQLDQQLSKPAPPIRQRVAKAPAKPAPRTSNEPAPKASTEPVSKVPEQATNPNLDAARAALKEAQESLAKILELEAQHQQARNNPVRAESYAGK